MEITLETADMILQPVEERMGPRLRKAKKLHELRGKGRLTDIYF